VFRVSLDVTMLRRKSASSSPRHAAGRGGGLRPVGVSSCRRRSAAGPFSTAASAASAQRCSRTGLRGGKRPQRTARGWAARGVGSGTPAAAPGPRRGTRRSRPRTPPPGAKSSATSSCELRTIGLSGGIAGTSPSARRPFNTRSAASTPTILPRATEAEIGQALLSATICRAIAADSSSSTTGVRSTSR
jgi:hypothetical protein